MNYLQFTTISKTFIKLSEFGEEISYTQPSAICRNIIIGSMHIDTAGIAEVTNHTIGDCIELKFYDEGKPKSIDNGLVEGIIKDIDGNVKGKLEGNLKSHFDIIYTKYDGKETKKTLWKPEIQNESESVQESRYYFSSFGQNLNNDDVNLLKSLPRTDCRLRPDMRFLEKQMYDEDTKEREILEDKQRKRLDELVKQKRTYQPIYFQESYYDITGELVFLFNGNYWKDKKENDFKKLPVLYKEF